MCLPVTREWTNRVEVADINGDNLLDILFANGGNYSEPGPLEYSRIFINQGLGKRFQEIIDEVFKGAEILFANPCIAGPKSLNIQNTHIR